jgi:hypothetical protein
MMLPSLGKKNNCPEGIPFSAGLPLRRLSCQGVFAIQAATGLIRAARRLPLHTRKTP